MALDRAAALEPIAPGITLGEQYQVVKRIGAGGMGEVFLASDLTLDRFVAIKVLRRDIGARLETDARFRREARVLSRLNHPNVVVIHAFGVAPHQRHYIVMEYVRGHTLEERLRRAGHFDPATFCQVLEQIAGAIAEAHRQGIIHRDLKPANVLVTSVGNNANYVKVVDFGVAKILGGSTTTPVAADASLSREGLFVGTPFYTSPEHVDGEELDARSDIYSLAVVACELLTGRRPIDGNSVQRVLFAHMIDAPKLPSVLAPEMGIDAHVDEVFARALQKRPDDRHASVEEFAAALLEAVRRWSGTAGADLRVRDSSVPVESDVPGALGGTLSDRVVVRVSDPGDLERTALFESEAGGKRVVRSATALVLELEHDAGAASVDLEEFLDCLALVSARLQRILAAHGGHAVGPLADRQLVLFGLDGKENEAESALDAALALRTALASLTQDPTIPHGFRLPFRIGLDAGPVMFATSARRGTVIHGAPLFEARRAASLAKQGEIRLTNAVYRRVRGVFECEVAASETQANPHRMAVAKKALPLLTRSDIHGSRVDLIGREAELEALRGALATVISTGAPRAIGVTGPPGVGKSRLVAEFLREIEDRPERFLVDVGRCTAGRQDVPYEPFVDAVRRRARIRDDDAPEQAKLKLEHYLRRFVAEHPMRLGDEERRIEQVLGELLGVDAEEAGREPRPEAVSGNEARRKLLFEAITDLYRRLSSRQPAVFILEDFEWASAGTKALLSHVLARIGPAKALFILVARAEQQNPELSFFRDGNAVSQIAVDPLRPESAETLARHMLRELVEVPPWLVRRVASLADGVPLILEETVHDLIDDGVIVVELGRWRLASSGVPTMRLPDTVEQLFLGRVERLEAPLRAAVHAAAVVGRRFWPSLLSDLVSGLPSDALAELVRRGFFMERRELLLGGEADYTFCQLATQESVYRHLPRPSRRDLHKKVAVWLERHSRATGARLADAIGHHFREAGEPGRALPHLRQAADRAVRMHAIEEAVRQLESCRAILSDGPTDLSEPERHGALMEVLADLVQQLVLAGDLQRAVSLAESAERGGGEDARAARISMWNGWALDRLGRYEDARRAFVAAQARFGHGADVRVDALMALAGEGEALLHLGEPATSAEKIGKVVASWTVDRSTKRAQEGERALSTAHRVLGNAELHLGSYDSAEASYRRAYDLALSANAPVEAVDALNGLAALHYFRGRPDEAESTWKTALAEIDHWDLLQHKGVVLGNLGELELSRGAVAQAIGTLQRAEALHSYLGSSRGLTEVARTLSECHLALGDLVQARAYAARSLEFAERVGSPYCLGNAHRALAKVTHASAIAQPSAGASSAVERHIEQSVAAFRAAGMEQLVAETEALREQLRVP